jgi:hypothetical protein
MMEGQVRVTVLATGFANRGNQAQQAASAYHAAPTTQSVVSTPATPQPVPAQATPPSTPTQPQQAATTDSAQRPQPGAPGAAPQQGQRSDTEEPVKTMNNDDLDIPAFLRRR